MSAAYFLEDENWQGGYYELAIDLGPNAAADSTTRLASALTTIWADECLQGCYLDRWTDRHAQQRVDPKLSEEEHPASLYGTAVLPSGDEIVCVTHIVRESGGPGPWHDWIDLCLPVGALERVDDRVGGYPFEQPDRSLVWRLPIDEWLVSIAQRVHVAAGFDQAIVDFEVCGIGLPEDTTAYTWTYLKASAGELAVVFASE